MKLKRFKIAIDILMTLLLPALSAYALIGEAAHEILGSVMFVLFIIHHVLNRRFFKAMFRGKYTPYRIFVTILDVLIFALMILQPLSGIIISKHLFTFIHLDGMVMSAREIHLCLAYWCLTLMSLHCGIHLAPIATRLYKKHRVIFFAALAIIAAISVYGAIAFINRGLIDYMLLKQSFAFFDYDEALISFFADYLAIMVLWITIGALAAKGLTRRKA